MQSLFTAASGLSGQQKRLDTLAVNIANASTPGYKSTRVDFKDSLYTVMDNPVLDNDLENNLLGGSGVTLDATNIDFRQGVSLDTGIPLDFFIDGDGFFQVRKENTEVLYTRNGSFSIAVIDDVGYLVTSQGYFVLDGEGNRIMMPETDAEFSVSENGVISTTEGEYGAIGLFRFSNPNGLAASGETCFMETAASGAPENDESSVVMQGKLENSNVDLAQELTILIRSQRAYSLASRALMTSDDMMGLANNMH
ncbi:MAG: flagellar hook-basal body protein [Clostridiales bacterium]|nr:flagellar hook-basal body protein [Clostridiales bacterium]